MEGELLSVRNVAEYAYCPRLFYLMQVEGIFVPSSDTVKGVLVHRRVDKPSARGKEKAENGADPEHPKIVRKLSLTSESLGLSAMLDLAEVSGKNAVPIEFRKGRPLRNVNNSTCTEHSSSNGYEREQKKAWPTDRIQVGLQSILLEESGYIVKEAIIYYAEENLRLRISVDDSLKQEALQILEHAKSCAEGPRPLPLINDPRCIKCSLQPVCLPDEVNFQLAMRKSDSISPRRIWPPRDDGIHVVTQQDGVKIGIRGLELLVTDRDGNKVKSIPIANIESLTLLGKIQLTTQAIWSLVDRNIPIALLSSAGRLITVIDPMYPVSADIRRMQVRILDEPTKCLELARSLVSAKIANQRTVLMRNCKALPREVPTILASEIKRVRESDTVEEVRGHEGKAASIYFRHFHSMLKGALAEEFRKNGRKRRPPPDPVNSCLSMAYSMLMNESISALRIAGLEPTIGGYHVTRPGRPALALDIIEPFRPLIADSLTITCFNRGELTEGHFLRTSEGCNFTSAGRKNFFEAYHRRMNTEVTHPVFKYRLSYRRMLILHARMLVAWLIGEIPDLSFLTTR
ncbi:MAG: CRISPR-associated endonuclease Cas1 [Actinobacteria bacterium]|nr:CRISPR-associated endonuclease Cas1 [Actinomycetota bacterium]